MTTWVTPPTRPPKSGIESSEINGRLIVDEQEIVVYNDSQVVQDIADHNSELKDLAINVKKFGAVGGATNDSSAFQNAVDYAIGNGHSKIYIPFNGITLSSSIDCKNLIIEGSNTVISGVLKNVKRFVDCTINNVDYENLAVSEVPQAVSITPKIIQKFTANSYYVMSKRPASDKYMLFLFERGILTTNNSVGGSADLLRPTSVYNIDDAVVYKHAYSLINGTWEDYNYSLPGGATTFRQLKFWRNTSVLSTDYIEFNVDVDSDGKLSLLFYSTASSDPNASILVDGVTVGTVKLNNFTGNMLFKTFDAPPGNRTIRIKTSGAFYIYVAGVNCYKLKDAPAGKVYDAMAYSGGGQPYINNKGAMEYAFYDVDSQIYYGSYHGGETLLSEEFQIDNQIVTLNVGDVKVGKSFSFKQKTNINNKFTANTLYQLKGDGLLEFTAHLTGGANLSTAYNCMATVNDSFTNVLFPKRVDITTDGEVYFGRVNKIIQENPATGQKITTFLTLFENDNNALGGVFIRRTAGAYNKVYYGSVVQSLKNVKDLSFQTKWLFE